MLMITLNEYNRVYSDILNHNENFNNILSELSDYTIYENGLPICHQLFLDMPDLFRYVEDLNLFYNFNFNGLSLFHLFIFSNFISYDDIDNFYFILDDIDVKGIPYKFYFNYLKNECQYQCFDYEIIKDRYETFLVEYIPG